MTNKDNQSSRLPGFYELPQADRIAITKQFAGLSENQASALSQFGALTSELADVFIENSIGSFPLPLGIATNFAINGIDMLIPMAVEESSVVAAASHGAKLSRSVYGFKTESTDPIMTGQIQLKILKPADFDGILTLKRDELIAFANKGHQNLTQRGGGAKDLTWHYINEIESLVIHLHVNTCDAMGANIVNTMCEKLSSQMPALFSCEVGLRILTNLTDRRLAKANCTVKQGVLKNHYLSGSEVVEKIVQAYKFAYYDPYRAATNNKGVMNGIDPVLIATGNDWRAVEAGAHAYSCRSGKYRPMAEWRILDNGDLYGELELPMAVGTVGGVTKLHPSAQASLKLLQNPSGRQLAEIVCAVGLAQNLSALRALASEGIQHGHMSLHKRNLEMLDSQQNGVRE